MGVRINTNIEALNAQRNLGVSSMQFGKSIEKLSSGLRINRAADDSAGLSISEKLRAQVKGLQQASRNAQDGMSMIGTAEGALSEVHSILQRMRELGVQAGNDTLSADDRTAVGQEVSDLQAEINRISATTKFNGKALLNGSTQTAVAAASEVKIGTTGSCVSTVVSKLDVTSALAGTTYTFSATGASLSLTNGTVTQSITVAQMGTSGTQVLNFSELGVQITVTGACSAAAASIAANFADTASDTLVTAAGSTSISFMIGAEAGQTMGIGFENMATSALGIDTSITNYKAAYDSTTAGAMVTALDAALVTVSTQRGKLGAAQNRLEHTVANLGVAAENLATSESRIRDADLAAETVYFTRTQILQQAGTAILAQANQAPQSVLSLLR